MFIYLNTVHSLNVCNAVKSVSSTHHMLFNAILLKQSIQNSLVFDILMNLILL